MDIVYIVKPGRVNDELTFSLRSLKNIPHGKVFIVGGCPANINKKNVCHIPTEQTATKWQNSTRNLLVACKDRQISKDFILFNDDFFILRPIQEQDLLLDRGPLIEVYNEYVGKYTDNEYIRGMRQTAELLKNLGIDNPISFELHIPMILNKNKVLKMFDLPGVKDIKVLHKRTLYGNLYLSGTQTVQDVKCYNHFNAHKPRTFLSSIDTFFEPLRYWLIGQFPNKCPYEI